MQATAPPLRLRGPDAYDLAPRRQPPEELARGQIIQRRIKACICRHQEAMPVAEAVEIADSVHGFRNSRDREHPETAADKPSSQLATIGGASPERSQICPRMPGRGGRPGRLGEHKIESDQ